MTTRLPTKLAERFVGARPPHCFSLWRRSRSMASVPRLIGLCLLLSTLAHAQQRPSSADEEARTLFAQGRAAYDAGRWSEAVAAFRRAYLLSGRPALLYNVGQSELRLAHNPLALEAFEGYLRHATPDDSRRAEVEERVRVLRGMGVVPPAGGEASGGPSGGFDPLGHHLLTWIALSVAGAAAVAALITGLVGNGTYDSLVAGCGATFSGCSDAQIGASGLPTLEALTNVFWISSGVAFAGAIALYLIEGWHGPESSARLRFDGTSLRGTF